MENKIIHKQGVYNELPIPFEYNGELVTNFTARELTLAEIKSLSKPQFKQNNPFKWIAKACCISIEEMGGVRVFEEYERTGKFPDIIRLLPMLDTNTVLVAGHIKTLGEHLQSIPGICPSCSHKQEAEIDLLSLNVPYVEDNTYEDYRVDVELEKGYDIGVKFAKDNGLTQLYNVISFRLPLMGDLLKLETKFRETNDINEFFESIMQTCIISLSNKGGEEFPENLLNLRRDRVINGLHPRDWKKTRNEYNKNAPDLDVSTKSPCENCGSSISYNLDSSFLFQ